jgi:hypothetical protein
MNMGGYAMACDKDAAKTACGKRVATPETALTVVYRVGDIETPCVKTAAAIAERDGLKVTYVAAGDAFETETEAKAALVKKIETAIAEMLEVRYAVDGECVSCPMSAAALAAKTGKPLKYRAAGHEFDSVGEAQAAVMQAKTVLASYASGCCASGKSASLASASEGAKSGCCSSAKAAVASSSCSSDAKATVASAGSSCSKGAKATTVAGSSSCSSAAKTAVAATCADAEKADAALAAAKARYEAVVASVSSTGASQG